MNTLCIYIKNNLRHYLYLCFLIVVFIGIQSCETSSLSELAVIDEENNTGDPDNDPDPDPDGENTGTLITYENRAKTILDNACVECHNTVTATAGVILDSFEAARAVAESGRMIDRMTNTNSPMPPSGNLPDAIIADIMMWIDDGLLEN